ncbi:MAG TPA: adenylate/guanylate cyclase domain-containing protein [Egibacteraceae bacterium]|nr:adenylate/guanylate cyclase domain-containing protein [Egibacteraceae bacterium]
MLAPSVAGGARFVAWWRRLERSSVTPNAAARFFRSMLELDVTPILPTVQTPTLVIHRRDAPLISADAARWFADQIPGARYLELPGADAVPYVGDVDEVLDEVEEFLTGAPPGGNGRPRAGDGRFDISGSTPLAQALGDRRWRDLLEEYRRVVRRLMARFRGREVDTAGDGFLPTFDGPARAVRGALSVREACTTLGLEVHVGVHTGEVEMRGGSISGLAVHVGARVGSGGAGRRGDRDEDRQGARHGIGPGVRRARTPRVPRSRRRLGAPSGCWAMAHVDGGDGLPVAT